MAEHPALMDSVRRMCVLNLNQVRVLATRVASTAAVSLLRLASPETADTPPEVTRKSCVDLLDLVRTLLDVGDMLPGRGGLGAASGRTHGPSSTFVATSAASSSPRAAVACASTGPGAPSEESILRALEAIDAQHQREPLPWPEGDAAHARE
jgi:hypothetical protein